MSFAHEFTHYLQLMTSAFAMRTMAEVLDAGVHSAQIIAGHIDSSRPISPSERRFIYPMLQMEPTGAGHQDTNIVARTVSIEDDLRTLFSDDAQPYTGTHKPWEICTQTIRYQGRSEEFWGFVTPSGTFRPFSPGLLAEGMARRTDQWLCRNESWQSPWAASVSETEYYNGILNILCQPAYAANVGTFDVEVLTVMVCQLALVTTIPDLAAKIMLDRISMDGALGDTPAEIGRALTQTLRREKLVWPPHAGNLDRVLDDLTTKGTAFDGMRRKELDALLFELRRFKWLAAEILGNPLLFADPTARWNTIISRIKRYGLPAVIVRDGELNGVYGEPCGNSLTRFLREIDRVIF